MEKSSAAHTNRLPEDHVKSLVIDPSTVELHPYQVAPERITPGTETTACRLWEREEGGEIGAVWQMSPGVLERVQGEETFVVVSGRATVEFDDGRVHEIGPGSVGAIAQEDIARWTVHETLRKVIVRRVR
jgi:uncharacterized cupin superfamily protein